MSRHVDPDHTTILGTVTRRDGSPMLDPPEPPSLPTLAPFGRAGEYSREMAPTWWNAILLLAAIRPLDLAAPLSIVDLQCGVGTRALVLAATHPRATIYACDAEPSNVEAVAQRAWAAGLENLVALDVRVGEAVDDQRLPPRIDALILADVFGAVSDEAGSAVALLIDRRLRPGGIVCASYRTLSGWSELLPVRTLARALARRSAEKSDDRSKRLVDLLAQLRDGGARYFADRPYLSSALAALEAGGGVHMLEQLTGDYFAPMTLLQVTELLTPARCSFIATRACPQD